MGGVRNLINQGKVAIRAIREYRAAGGLSTFTEPQEWLMQIFGTQAKTGAIVNENSALTVATFASCVNILSSSISNFPLRLMRKTPKGAESAIDHPLFDLLQTAPNSTQTSFRWRSFEMACICLGGNGYSRIVRNPLGEIQEIRPMLPYKTQPRVLEGGMYDGMMVYAYQGEKLMPHDVLHLRGLSTDGFYGISPIRALRETLGLSISMQEFTARTFNNGNRQPGVLKGPAQMNKEKAAEFLQAWQAQQAGAQNAGRTPLLFGGMDWVNAGFTNQDAELLLNRKFEKEEIAGWFRIPCVLIGDTDKTSSWGTGIEQLIRGFVSFTLQPHATNWEQEMNAALLTQAERKQGLFLKFDFGELLRGSVSDQANYLKTLWSVGAASSNEIRRQLHIPAIEGPEGDLFYVPTNVKIADGKQPTPGAGADGSPIDGTKDEPAAKNT